MVRVLTAMSWCGRSSKLWHKNGNMDSRRPNSASNRVMPADSAAEVASSDKVCNSPAPKSPTRKTSMRHAGAHSMHSFSEHRVPRCQDADICFQENVRPSPVDVVNRSDEMTDAFQLFCPICMWESVPWPPPPPVIPLVPCLPVPTLPACCQRGASPPTFFSSALDAVATANFAGTTMQRCSRQNAVITTSAQTARRRCCGGKEVRAPAHFRTLRSRSCPARTAATRCCG